MRSVESEVTLARDNPQLCASVRQEVARPLRKPVIDLGATVLGDVLETDAERLLVELDALPGKRRSGVDELFCTPTECLSGVEGAILAQGLLTGGLTLSF